jgi:hypothetical protein
MRKTTIETWVVYRATAMVQTKKLESNAVCAESDWNAMEAAQPGRHTLIQAGIADEAVAEKLARGTSGDLVRRLK